MFTFLRYYDVWNKACFGISEPSNVKETSYEHCYNLSYRNTPILQLYAIGMASLYTGLIVKAQITIFVFIFVEIPPNTWRSLEYIAWCN